MPQNLAKKKPLKCPKKLQKSAKKALKAISPKNIY